jgi:(p)ppGpp synthase/HD superfamily hydrolase
MSTLADAIALAAMKFSDTYDKGGEPYILHCLYVMNQMDPADHELMSIAVLHDIIEDTDVTASLLELHGFSDRVIAGVVALTHEKDEPYMDYIKRIALNPDARLIKMADLDHNSRILRMKGLRKKDFDRLQKYFTAYEYLKG